MIAANATVTTPPPSLRNSNETQEIASFLLSLKHTDGDRPVTPDTSTFSPGSSKDLVRQCRPPTHPSPPHYKLPYPAHNHYPHYSPYSYTPHTTYLEHRHHAHHYPHPHHLNMPPAGIEDSPASLMSSISAVDMDWDSLLADSKLVHKKDRDLVPDALFVAMAQMKPCRLTEQDRVGCYKGREIGFVGMCCKHCGGQPGFGRFYPNSVRSLAQTTTSQTILKHIGNKCRFCPSNIRNAVLDLQQQQSVREGVSTGRPRYGSRKIFFQRIWTRLHGSSKTGKIVDDDAKLICEISKHADDASNDTPSDVDEETSMASYHSSSDSVNESPNVKRKMHFESIAMNNTKRAKYMV